MSPLAFDHSQKYLMFYWQVNVRYFGLGWSMSIGLIYGVIKVSPCIFLYLHVLSSSQENDWLKFANKGITEWKFPLSPKTIAFKLNCRSFVLLRKWRWTENLRHTNTVLTILTRLNVMSDSSALPERFFLELELEFGI